LRKTFAVPPQLAGVYLVLLTRITRAYSYWEFKLEVVRMVHEKGYSAREAAELLENILRPAAKQLQGAWGV
jgi:hypothetical protein